MLSGVDSGPNLLLDWHQPTTRVGFGGRARLPPRACGDLRAGGTASEPERSRAQGSHRDYSGFQTGRPSEYCPRTLTQKAPNKGKVAKEVNVEDLKPRPASQERLPPAPAIRSFQPPKPQPPGPQQSAAAPRIAEPPKIETPVTAQNAPPLPPALAGTPKAPPTQIQPVEQPKLAFETPGQEGTSERKGQAKLTPPKIGCPSYSSRHGARRWRTRQRRCRRFGSAARPASKRAPARSNATARQQSRAEERH